MNATAIVNRIEQRLNELQIKARAASINAGLSGDAIRNWQRRLVTDPDSVGITIDALAAVARALDVDFLWLLRGGPAPDETPRPSGMAEEAEPFTHNPAKDDHPLMGLFAEKSRNAAITAKAMIDMPGFGISKGDLVVCDLARQPNPGEVAVAVLIDTDHATSYTLIRRFSPPYLLAGDQLATPAIDYAAASLDIRHPVIGIIRGT